MDRKRYRIGTDGRETLSSVPVNELSQLQASTEAPAGVRHAVPHDAPVALCGHRPQVVWEETVFPGIGRARELCSACLHAVHGVVEA